MKGVIRAHEERTIVGQVFLLSTSIVVILPVRKLYINQILRHWRADRAEHTFTDPNLLLMVERIPQTIWLKPDYFPEMSSLELGKPKRPSDNPQQPKRSARPVN